MNYLERLRNEIIGLREINQLIPTLEITDEQKKLLQDLVKEGIFSKDAMLKSIEKSFDEANYGKETTPIKK